MALVKVLTKDDLATYQDLLEEHNRALEKLLVESARLMNSGGMAAKFCVEQIVQSTLWVDRARMTNQAQLSQWDELKSLSESEKYTYMAHYMSIKLAVERAKRAAEQEAAAAATARTNN